MGPRRGGTLPESAGVRKIMREKPGWGPQAGRPSQRLLLGLFIWAMVVGGVSGKLRPIE